MESTSTTKPESTGSPEAGPPAARTVVVHRLRDLDRAGRLVALALTLLLAIPFVVSMVRALDDGWVPSGDEAVIAVRVHDTVTGHAPLTGLPSTSDLYGGGIKTRHPGPIEFYVLALPVKLLGLDAGMLLGAGAVNLGAVLVAAWALFRRAGPAVGSWGAVLLAATVWSTGTAVLTDPISSNMGGYPLLCLTVLAWALACGDRRLLPLAVGVASYAAQQHLAVVLPVLLVSAWGAGGLAWMSWSERRAWATTPSLVGGRTGQVGARLWPWVAGAAALGAVLWAPVAIDQFTGDPGNLTAVVRFAQDSDRATLGTRSGVKQVLRVAGLPPWMLRNDLTGFQVAAPLSGARAASGVVVLGVMAAVGVGAFRRRPDLSRLGLTALVVAVAGVASGASVPASIEADRINLYRWTWPLALCTVLLLGWLAALAAAALVRQRPTPLPAGGRRVGVTTAVVVTGLFTYSSVATVGLDDERRDASVFAIDDQLGDAAVDALQSSCDGPVMVVTVGSMSTLSVSPAILARLADADIEFQVPARQADAYGEKRAFDPATAECALVVASAYGPLDPVPGRLLGEADLNPDLAAPVDRLVALVEGADIVYSEQAPALLDAALPTLRETARSQLDRLSEDPYPALSSSIALYLLSRGYVARPQLPAADVAALLEASNTRTLTVWGDDRVSLHLQTMDELRDFRPELFD